LTEMKFIKRYLSRQKILKGIKQYMVESNATS
jgi:hypothetical protein